MLETNASSRGRKGSIGGTLPGAPILPNLGFGGRCGSTCGEPSGWVPWMQDLGDLSLRSRWFPAGGSILAPSFNQMGGNNLLSPTGSPLNPCRVRMQPSPWACWTAADWRCRGPVTD